MSKRASFEERRAHLREMSDAELRDYFWQLTDHVITPLLEAGRVYTSPAIERSVLLRMGFSSLEATPIVEGLIDRNLIGKGAGHVVWRLAESLGISVREAGVALARGEHWEMAAGLFGETR